MRGVGFVVQYGFAGGSIILLLGFLPENCTKGRAGCTLSVVSDGLEKRWRFSTMKGDLLNHRHIHLAVRDRLQSRNWWTSRTDRHSGG